MRVTAILVEPDRAALEGIAALIADDALNVNVAQTLPLSGRPRTRARRVGGRARGKIVLTVPRARATP